MTTHNIIDVIALSLLGACVAFWPTQLIPDQHYRWLRIAAVTTVVVQVFVIGWSVPMLPAYGVAMLFAVLLVGGPGTKHGPSKIRESTEGLKKKMVRWAMVVACGLAVLLSIFLRFVATRAE
jgi:hypothetical protein